MGWKMFFQIMTLILVTLTLFRFYGHQYDYFKTNEDGLIRVGKFSGEVRIYDYRKDKWTYLF